MTGGMSALHVPSPTRCYKPKTQRSLNALLGWVAISPFHFATKELGHRDCSDIEGDTD